MLTRVSRRTHALLVGVPSKFQAVTFRGGIPEIPNISRKSHPVAICSVERRFSAGSKAFIPSSTHRAPLRSIQHAPASRIRLHLAKIWMLSGLQPLQVSTPEAIDPTYRAGVSNEYVSPLRRLRISMELELTPRVGAKIPQDRDHHSDHIGAVAAGASSFRFEFRSPSFASVLHDDPPSSRRRPCPSPPPIPFTILPGTASFRQITVLGNFHGAQDASRCDRPGSWRRLSAEEKLRTRPVR